MEKSINPRQVLQQYFGYSEFRNQQESIINNVLAGKDTLVLMPTGGGKSICYQVPALVLKGLTVVISPLIALMKDQVDALRVNGVKAAFINSSLSTQERSEIIQQLRNKELKLLYLAPEKLIGKDSRFLDFLQTLNVSMIAVDEAHCISAWGHDFRPEYLMLAELKTAMPLVPVIALTATADKLTRKDIVDKLNLNDPEVFISSFNRANIKYHVEPKRKSFDKLVDFLTQRQDESGIVYCLSRDSTEITATQLQNLGYSALPYHAGLDKTLRDKHQEMFLKDKVKIMVATIAFGMGIDKSNVRFVVHMDLPKNIEGYYQETGRAGRDGLPSDALLFFSQGDVSKLRHFATIENNPEQSRIMLKKLDQMVNYCELNSCRRKYLLNYFDEQASDYCGSCDVCLNKYELFDGTLIAQKALSAVARLNNAFGAGYVIDFLRGSKSEKIRPEHTQLKTYGVGADLKKEDWADYIDQLVRQGYLQKSQGQYPVLQLTETSALVLKGLSKVNFTKRKESILSRPETMKMDYEDALFKDLKLLRNQIAEERNVPAYIILSDSTLMEMANYLPINMLHLAKISGFGQMKLEVYGNQFLKMVQNYCEHHQLGSRMSMKNPKRDRAPKKEILNDTKKLSFDLYKQGRSISEIAQERNLSPTTIESHLGFFIQNGQIDVLELVSPEKLTIILQALKQFDGLALSPIKEYLGDQYTYGEIKAAIAHSKINQ